MPAGSFHDIIYLQTPVIRGYHKGVLMQAVKFDERILSELNEEPEQFDTDVRLAAALRFYRHHKLTLGQAAEMAKKSQSEFMRSLSENGIPAIDYPADDLAAEAATA